MGLGAVGAIAVDSISLTLPPVLHQVYLSSDDGDVATDEAAEMVLYRVGWRRGMRIVQPS